MEVEFLGGAGEVGRSAVLVDGRLLVDYGTAATNPPRYPVGDVDPDAVVVSHGHLDHAGAVPALLASDARPPVHWTPPTRDLAMVLAEDTLSLHGGTPRCPFTETDEYKQVGIHFERHRFSPWWRVEQDVNRELVKYIRGDSLGKSSRQEPVDTYLHTYFEDIETVYGEGIYHPGI